MNRRALYTAYLGLVTKEISRFLRIWPQTLLPAAVTMILYFMIFGHVIGKKIGTMDNIDYMLYITPGLIMLSIITNSFTNVVGSFFIARYNKSIEEMLISPMPNWLIILGYVSGGSLRGLLVGIITTIIGALFSSINVEHVSLTLITAVLASILFSLAGLLNGIFARNFDDTSTVVTFVLTPLIYLGGVFYSINSLSPFWRAISQLNPVYYIVDLLRYAMLGTNSSSVAISLSILMLIILALFSICLYCLKSGYRIRV